MASFISCYTNSSAFHPKYKRPGSCHTSAAGTYPPADFPSWEGSWHMKEKRKRGELAGARFPCCSCGFSVPEPQDVVPRLNSNFNLVSSASTKSHQPPALILPFNVHFQHTAALFVYPRTTHQPTPTLPSTKACAPHALRRDPPSCPPQNPPRLTRSPPPPTSSAPTRRMPTSPVISPR